MVGHRVHLSVISVAAMLPWGLWSVEALPKRRATTFAWMTPVVYLAITGGHWPTLVHVGLIWTVYTLLRVRPLGRSAAVVVAAMVLAAVIAAPQILATKALLAQTTRQRIGYAMAGENSFFPLSGILAVFPFFFGTRTPNFFPQRWWGPWHLCETLGYVGLLTLVLAAAAVWTLYRKSPRVRKHAGPRLDTTCEASSAGLSKAPAEETVTPIVRVWSWMALGAGVWMLGYYLPTYRLVHLLPVLGVMRCPGRMILAVDMALATLAAIAVHKVASAAGREDGRAKQLWARIRRGAMVILPVTMLATLLIVFAAARLLDIIWKGQLPGFEFFCGGTKDALAAIAATNPAVWVPILLAAATGVAVWFWLGSPRRRVWIVIVMIFVDLSFTTRFVDVPAGGAVPPDPEESPAATWLRQHDPDTSRYRIWGLGNPYGSRQAELLLAKTCQSLGFRTISNYGPFQSPRHAHLFGFRIFGTNRNWARLVRRNHLLSLYGVRYLIAEADSEHSRVIESVRTTSPAADDDSPDLLTGAWKLKNAEARGDVLHLQTHFLWRRSQATRPVTMAPGEVYRIALDARGPGGGAANFLRVDVFKSFDGAYFQRDAMAMIVHAEQIVPQWRHFEWTFQTPQELPEGLVFRIFTMSERPIEVRSVSVRRSRWESPLTPPDVPPGTAVYGKLTEVDARDPSDARVSIYENLFCRSVQAAPAAGRPTELEIESLKWADRAAFPEGLQPPSVAVHTKVWPENRMNVILVLTTAPAAVLYLAVVGILLCPWSRRRRLQKNAQTCWTDRSYRYNKREKNGLGSGAAPDRDSGPRLS